MVTFTVGFVDDTLKKSILFIKFSADFNYLQLISTYMISYLYSLIIEPALDLKRQATNEYTKKNPHSY